MDSAFMSEVMSVMSHKFDPLQFTGVSIISSDPQWKMAMPGLRRNTTIESFV